MTDLLSPQDPASRHQPATAHMPASDHQPATSHMPGNDHHPDVVHHRAGSATTRQQQLDDSGTLGRLVGRISRLEMVVGGAIAVILALLVVLEPDILEAPFENTTTLVFTLGGTAAAAVGFALMLWFRVPPAVRVVLLVVPFALVNWWLLSPYFIDDVVDEQFATSIAAQTSGTPQSAVPSENSATDSAITTDQNAGNGAEARSTRSTSRPDSGLPSIRPRDRRATSLTPRRR